MLIWENKTDSGLKIKDFRLKFKEKILKSYKPTTLILQPKS